MIQIRESLPSDNDALLHLTRATPMDGHIALRIDRDPDFDALNELRGSCTTLVAHEDDQIVGCVTITHHSAFVSGRKEQVGYLADLKVLPSHRGGTVTYRLMNAAREYIQSRGTDLYLCVVAGGNSFMSDLLTGRAGFPAFRHRGCFEVYSLLPSVRRPGQSGFRIEHLDAPDTTELQDFVNRTNRSFLLAPEVNLDDIPSSPGSRSGYARTLIARHADEIVATLTAFDASHLKTNVLIDLPTSLALLTRASRVLERWIPMVHLPRKGEAINILYLRHVAVKPGYEDALRHLVQIIRKHAYKKGYSFVTVGFHERDTRKRVFRGMLKFQFTSEAYLSSLKTGDSRLDALQEEIPAEDFALV